MTTACKGLDCLHGYGRTRRSVVEREPQMQVCVRDNWTQVWQTEDDDAMGRMTLT